MARKTRAEQEQEAAQLRATQEPAMEALLAGRTITDAAAAAGVARETLSRWLNHDAAFISAYNQRRNDMWEYSADRLRRLSDRTVDALEELLGHEDAGVRLKAVAAVHRALALLPDNGNPGGPVSERAAWRNISLRDW